MTRKRLGNRGKAQRRRFLLLDFVFDDDAQGVSLFEEYGIALFGHYTHRRHKAIAALGNSFDVPLLMPVIAESATSGGDVLRQVVLFNIDIGPDNLDQLIFSYDMHTPLNQSKQGVKNLRRESYGLAVTQQNTLKRINAEIVKVVKTPL